MAGVFESEFSFYSQLYGFYRHNKKKIRRNYRALTKKFLAYNDPEGGESAFLRRPQFEALSMYVFIKEFMQNAQVYEMFDDWRNRRGKFSEASYYGDGGQLGLFDTSVSIQTDALFSRMKQYREDYPNYIYALTMGLGKTILMAACIYYEFLLANQYPDDKLFCHNALIFAPDKTVLQSLREIEKFDKVKIVPPEYLRILEGISFHFLDDSGMTLNILDGSRFNIIISNTQKIILKRKHKQPSSAQILFETPILSEVYGISGGDDSALMENQRFEKLCRLPQLGVYVDEAHHLFGADLEKQIRSGGGKKTSLRDTINMLSEKTSIVGCYNYTGTPYIESQILPEVVYAYGLRESIQSGYLKDAKPIGFGNVKDSEFLRAAVKRFWDSYGGETYEGLNPKLAIYASGIDEAVKIVHPMLEEILSELNIPLSKILVNVGDPKYTSNTDIRDFNNLDVKNSDGNEKQFIILVERGKEGWNCRSLFGVAMFRSPRSKIFVLQATMRCLRSITGEQHTALVFLSKENFDILNDELHKNFNMDIKDMSGSSGVKRSKYQVRVVLPLRKITMKRVWHEYTLREKKYSGPVDFGLRDADLSHYESLIYTAGTLGHEKTQRKENADNLRDNMKYSEFTLAGEIARYLNISCVLAAKILRESADGITTILESVNKYNQVIYDIIIPAIFSALFEVTSEQKSEDKEIILLREPREGDCYEFSARDDLVVTRDIFPDEQTAKSFHADTYCFDSKPERKFFEHYIASDKVKEIYFTGMFTSDQGDLSVYYYDPESGMLRKYYPDFCARMNDGSYRLIEVKREDMIDSSVIKAKTDATREIAGASGIEYRLYSERDITNGNIFA